MKRIRRIVLAVAVCMVIGLQSTTPAMALEARYAVCPGCGGNVSVYTTTETACEVSKCTEAAHKGLNCEVHTTVTTVYRVTDCRDCGDYSKAPIKTDRDVPKHLIG